MDEMYPHFDRSCDKLLAFKENQQHQRDKQATRDCRTFTHGLWRTHTHHDVDPVGFHVLSGSCSAEDILGQECCLRVTQGWWCDWSKVDVVATRTVTSIVSGVEMPTKTTVWPVVPNIEYVVVAQRTLYSIKRRDCLVTLCWLILTCVSIYFCPVLTTTHSLSDNFIGSKNKTGATMAWTMTMCL